MLIQIDYRRSRFMKKLYISMILNALIVIFVIFGCIIMFAGLQFMGEGRILSETGVYMLKFYTVDSNILAGLSSILLLVHQFYIIKGATRRIPVAVMIFKQITTVALTITFLVTLFYLAPFSPYGFFSLYLNANLFFHLIVPVLAIISYVFFEKYKNDTEYAWWGLSTMIIYITYYLTNIIAHIAENNIPKYDFYGFTNGNLRNIAVIVPIFLLLTYWVSDGLIRLNLKFSKYRLK
jgi:hypothetical protein